MQIIFFDIKEFKNGNFYKKCRKSIYGIKLSKFKINKDKLLSRRSIYFSNNLIKNQIITKNDIKIVRPEKGMQPKEFSKIIGMRVTKNIKIGDRVTSTSVKKIITFYILRTIIIQLAMGIMQDQKIYFCLKKNSKFIFFST